MNDLIGKLIHKHEQKRKTCIQNIRHDKTANLKKITFINKKLEHLNI